MAQIEVMVYYKLYRTHIYDILFIDNSDVPIRSIMAIELKYFR